MKLQLLTLSSTVMLTLTAHAGIFTSVNANIPDGSAVGWSGTAKAGGYAAHITDVSVTLNISGGYNGDLYAYLSHGGVLVPLLNRVGVGTGDAFGYGTAGMNITLADGYTDIHTVAAPISGNSYAPDGRAIIPATSLPDLTGSRVNFGAYYDNGVNPNGTWTLFIADLSKGGQSQLVSWDLGIIAEVPEPANVALGIFAGVFLVVTAARSQWARNRVQRCRAAFVRWVNAV
jgi:subtilisin-like proprotein convertase family protein